MKKFMLFSLLAISSYSFAQESDTKKQDMNVSYYFGVGANVNSRYAIDDKLAASGMPETVKTTPEFIFGIDYMGKKGSLDTEFASQFFKKSNEFSTSSGSSFAIKLRGHYNFVNSAKFLFSGGLNLAYTTNDFNLYASNNQVDLNALGTSNASYIRLRNGMFYTGPSIAFGLKKNDKVSLRLNIGYEFALITGKWKSDYAAVSNSFTENGHNRFVMGLVVYSNRTKYKKD
ncbi:hypothetical protein [Flavobacterium aciduliphilum]|nr:hypothetical protein [Flavobacterium aciduliphilum]